MFAMLRCQPSEVIAASSRMPTISMFYGVAIRMYWADHAPPHFHAQYGAEEAVIEIKTLRMTRGSLPRRALG